VNGVVMVVAEAPAAWAELPYLPSNGGLALPWFPAGELLGLETGEERWLVDRLIPAETINMLVGNPGTGKSLLVIDLCCCIATGMPFLGRDVRRGKVMYLAAEDGWRRVSKRLRAWADGQMVPPDALDGFYVLPSALQIAAGEGYGDQSEAMQAAWDQLQEDVEAIDPVLVVLDPLVELHAGLDENKATEMAPLMKTLRRLVRGRDRALILTHHDKKGVTEPNVYSSRGSGALPGGMDGSYYLAPHKREEGDEEDAALQVLLHVTKGRDLPPSLKRPVGLRYVNGHWHVDESVVSAKRAKEIDQLYRAYDFLTARERATVNEARLELDIPYNTMHERLKHLEAIGAAVYVSRERPIAFAANPGARERIAGRVASFNH
jgi:RecA-family ATPase